MKLISGLIIFTGVGICRGNPEALTNTVHADVAVFSASRAVDAMVDMANVVRESEKFLFDDETLEAAAKSIAANASTYGKIIQHDGKKALDTLESARSSYKLARLTVTRMLNTLKYDAEFTKELMETVPTGPLTMNERGALNAALKLVVGTLTQAQKDSMQQGAHLAAINASMVNVSKTLETVLSRFEQAKLEASSYMESRIVTWRAAWYAGCVASIAFPPALPACYALAAGIIEGKVVPEIKAELTGITTQYGEFADVFKSLQNSSNILQNRTHRGMEVLESFTKTVGAAKDDVSQATSVSLGSKIIRDMFLVKLDFLITTCNTVLAGFEKKFNTKMRGAPRKLRESTVDEQFMYMAKDQARKYAIALLKNSTKYQTTNLGPRPKTPRH
mmetsp:Transcript_1790/g.2699  ORF Transcript_1790/g.2699 Transcript_1790/m.2699 type:complete len:390 (-) Transcript_1790:34-1203(-)